MKINKEMITEKDFTLWKLRAIYQEKSDTGEDVYSYGLIPIGDRSLYYADVWYTKKYPKGVAVIYKPGNAEKVFEYVEAKTFFDVLDRKKEKFNLPDVYKNDNGVWVKVK